MKTKSALLLTSFFIFGSAFTLHNSKNQKPFSFKIIGTTRNFPGKIIYIHHKWDEKDFLDSALTENNRFEIELKSLEPNMYWFTLTRDVNAQPNAIFFADKVNVKATVIGDSIASSVITGGPTQTVYLEYIKLSASLATQQQKLQEDYKIATQQRDQNAIYKIQMDYQALGQQHISHLKNFVKTHSKSAVSGYIVYKEFSNPEIPIEHGIECLGYLDKSIENTKFVKLASKKINDIKGTMVGGKATDFSQATAEGKQVKLSDFKGKYVLVDFWASWCRPCRMENPNVVAAYNNFKDKDFTVLSISLDTNRDQWLAAVQADQLTWTNLSDLKGGANEVATLYNIQNIPQNVLVDKDGIIVAKNLRGPALDEKLKEVIK